MKYIKATEVGSRRYKLENIPQSKSYLKIKYTNTVNTCVEKYQRKHTKVCSRRYELQPTTNSYLK